MHANPPVRAPAPPTRGVKLFWGAAILGFFAFGVGALKSFVDQRDVAGSLASQGVETDARVMSATEVKGRRIATYHKLRVSYDPPGPTFLAFAEVPDCDGARWDPAQTSVRVVYLPDAPEVIRLAACRASFDTDWLPGIVGVGFVAFGLFLGWKSRGLFTASRPAA